MRSTYFHALLGSLIFWLGAVSSTQVWSAQPEEAPGTPQEPNLLDVLAASPNHTIFVRLLQRARLVPTLMNLMEYDDSRGLTIMAPTDDAIRRRSEADREARTVQANSVQLAAEYDESLYSARSVWEWAMFLSDQANDSDKDFIAPLWQSVGTSRLGNVNAILRQQLLYHMINYTLPYNFTDEGSLEIQTTTLSPGSKDNVTLHTTLHRPSRRLLHEPTRPGPVPQPPSQPPHPGAEDDGGLLAGEGQKLHFTLKGDGKVWVGTTSKGTGGVQVRRAGRASHRGLLLSIEGIMELPPSLEKLLETHPALQYLRNLTTSTSLSTLAETAHTTFFLPTEGSFECLSALEKTYITGEWDLAMQDRVKLLGEHMSGVGLSHGKVAYAPRLRERGALNMTTIFGGQLYVHDDENGMLHVAGAKVLEEDILIENGVVHIIDHLLLPFGDLNLSVEKTLLALNASRFVSLMHTAGLRNYIEAEPHNNDDPDHIAEPWTFMVPRDDSIDQWWNDRQDNFAYQSSKWGVPRPFNGDFASLSNASDLVELLKYHVAPRQLSPENLTDGMLLKTELRDWKLKDARQRVSVEVQDLNSERQERQGNGDVGFGDANVIATPVIVGPSIIYLISKMLTPPSNPLQTAVSSLSLSTFVAAVFSADLDKGIKHAPAITYLVPRNEAFAALGLAMQYLLLDQTTPRNELRSMVEYHAIDQIVYMKDFASGSMRYPTLEKSPIWAGRDEKGIVEVKRGTVGRNARILKGDFLTSTGVLHEIDQVELPPTLDLTIEKLMKGAKADTMKDLIQQAGYGWILNGSTPTLAQHEMLDSLSKFPHGKKKKREEKRRRKRHELFDDHSQSYVVLCPTDSAFTKINLTHYYSDPEALKALVQLHIIPSPADQILPEGTDDQLPLGIKDSSTFTTLLDSAVGGLSSYGKLAFRKVKGKSSKSFASDPDETNLGWVVGVADTRGTDGRKYAAKVLSFGRESLSSDRETSLSSAILRKKRPDDDASGDASRAVGGILTIDNVLQPYKPGWFYRWGWIALTSFFVGLVLASIGYGVWFWWHKDGRIMLPEALEGEEE